MKTFITFIALVFLVGCGDIPFDSVGSSTECIVGGTEVGLGPDYSTVDLVVCTGIYIAPGVVLTAAHCGDRRVARVGEVEANTVLRVEHPAYQANNLVNDLALLFLDNELPSDIATLGFATYGAATIQGFGLDETCSHGTLREATTFIESIYTHKLLTAPGPDSCYGDSGGPLYQGGAVVGIVSSAAPGAGGGMDSCGKGGLYTLVSAYADWLNSEVTNLQWELL